ERDGDVRLAEQGRASGEHTASDGSVALGSMVLEHLDPCRLRQALRLGRLLQGHRDTEQRTALAAGTRLVGSTRCLEGTLRSAHRDRIERLVVLVDAGEVHLSELDRADVL